MRSYPTPLDQRIGTLIAIAGYVAGALAGAAITVFLLYLCW